MGNFAARFKPFAPHGAPVHPFSKNLDIHVAAVALYVAWLTEVAMVRNAFASLLEELRDWSRRELD